MRRAGVHYVAALEQLAPAEAVSLAALADKHGFAGTVVSDRFQPWLPQQGSAAFCWAVAGAIGQQTTGEITVSAVPGYRIHPAGVAQASATLATLYPHRHRLLLSAGDAIDEHIVGTYWPESHERAGRVFEAAELIRKLFASSGKGKDVRHLGENFRMETTRLWGLQPPPYVQLWAGGPVTARRAGRSGNGIVALAGGHDRLADILQSFREGAEERSHDEAKPQATVHAQLSWAHTEDDAMGNVLHDWPMAGLRFPRGDIRSPFDVAQLARSVTEADVRARIPVSADPEVHRAYVQSFFELGFDTVHLHNVGRNQAEWIKLYATEIAPRLAGDQWLT